MNKKELLKLMEELDQYISGCSDDRKTTKNSAVALKNHVNTILDNNGLLIENDIINKYYDDIDFLNQYDIESRLIRINDGVILASFKHKINEFDYQSYDESYNSFIAIFNLLNMYIFSFNDANIFDINEIIKNISGSFLNNHLDKNKGTNFILNEFDKYDKLCRDNNITVKYHIKNNNIKKYYEIYAEYSNDMYDLQSSVRVVNYLKQPVELNRVALIKLACLEEILKMIRLNTIA